jgi:hypothetical protein
MEMREFIYLLYTLRYGQVSPSGEDESYLFLPDRKISHHQFAHRLHKVQTTLRVH